MVKPSFVWIAKLLFTALSISENNRDPFSLFLHSHNKHVLSIPIYPLLDSANKTDMIPALMELDNSPEHLFSSNLWYESLYSKMSHSCWNVPSLECHRCLSSWVAYMQVAQLHRPDSVRTDTLHWTLFCLHVTILVHSQ